MEQARDFVPLGERERPSICAAAVIMTIAALGLWAAGPVIDLMPAGDGSMVELWVDLIYYVPFVLLPVLVYALRRRGLTEALRLNPMPFIPTLMIVPMAVMSVYIASALSGFWMLLLDGLGLKVPDGAFDVGTSGPLVLAVIHTAAIPAVCEELVCRGVVFAAFERRGTAAGIVISSILFGLLHANIYCLPAYIVVGAISGCVVYALDSLYAGMLYHTVYNTAVLVINHMASGQAVEAAEAMPAGALMAAMAADLLVTGLAVGLTLKALNFRRRAAGIEPIPATKVPLTGRDVAGLVIMGLTLTASMVLVEVLS